MAAPPTITVFWAKELITFPVIMVNAITGIIKMRFIN
jgi:hypothetical protein